MAVYATVREVVGSRGGDTLGIYQIDDAIANLTTRPDVVRHPVGTLFIQVKVITGGAFVALSAPLLFVKETAPYVSPATFSAVTTTT